MNDINFNPEKHYLGKPCNYGHLYKDTGKTVRFKNDHGCTKCKVDRCHNWRMKNNVDWTHSWGTQSEIKFLSKIGEHGRKKLDVKQQLVNYINCSENRDWGNIDGDEVLSYAYSKLLSLGGSK